MFGFASSARNFITFFVGLPLLDLVIKLLYLSDLAKVSLPPKTMRRSIGQVMVRQVWVIYLVTAAAV